MDLDWDSIENKDTQKTSGREEKSMSAPTKLMIFAAAAVIVGIIAIGLLALVILIFLLGGLNYLPYPVPLAGEGTPAAAWHSYDGRINVNTEKLARTDPVVAIWQSHYACFIRPNDNAAVDYRSDTIGDYRTENFILIFYNDNTYYIYDRNNSTYKKGTWSKVTGSEYTLNEGTIMASPEKIVDNPASGSIQLQTIQEGTPPHVKFAFMDYSMVDYSPLMPDTIDKINKKP